MEKQYELNGHTIFVEFSPGMLRIKGTNALQSYLSTDIEVRSNALVGFIKQDYRLFFGKEINISNKSMVVEIWGHLFASRFALRLKKTLNYRFIRKLSEKISTRSDTIDCGERLLDQNRLFWDVVSGLKPMILFFIPREIKRTR
ncbi:MAG: hypothetical protein REI78_09005 [Pedobacter sp.]|nr:hypothetical protein [Pedobacter sp.]MDQ8053155.1 hypothetical protein [Pedobacter sp.]